MPGRIGLAAGLAALVVGLAGCWPVPGQSADRDGYNEFENGFDATSVATFTQRWSATLDVSSTGVGSPVITVVNGVRVHVASGRTVYTLNGGNGSVVWSSVPKGAGTFEELDTELFVFRDFLTASVRASGTSWQAAQCSLTTGNCDTLGGEVPGRVESVRDTGSGAYPLLLLSTFAAGSQSAYGYFGGPQTVHLTDQPGPARLTESATQLFHAGVGDGTAPANGVRAFPIKGGAGWSTAIDGTVATAPVLSGDAATVYVGTDAGTVYALATADGSILWSAGVGAAVTDSPALAQGRLHVPTASGLVTLSTAGAPLWTSSDTGRVTVQPAVAAGVVFAGTADGVEAYDATGCGAATCDTVWDVTTGSEITGAPAVTAGRLYVGTQDGRLVSYGLPPS